MGTVLAATSLTEGVTGWPAVAASLVLVALALALAWWLELGINRDVIEAVVRAAVQLLAVGGIFVVIFRSTHAMWWASVWVAVMVTIATVVIVRRARHSIANLAIVAGAAVAGTALISIVIAFGFGVFSLEAVSLVVVAGITIGNAVPSAVLAVNQAVGMCHDRLGDVEALLALGFDRRQVVRLMSPRAARSALIPQVERTKVVGLIALPGAMTGLLLAGVEPVEAVTVQLLVMYLVLGTAAVCVVTLVSAVVAAAVTKDLRPAEWTRAGPPG